MERGLWMSKATYLVKKNPAARKKETEWQELSGKEFYALLQSKEGKGRYFIHLVDDIAYEVGEIYIEASHEEYTAWKKEENARQYRRRQQEKAEIFSLDRLIEETGSCLEERLADKAVSVENFILEQEQKERLHRAVAFLLPEEQEILRALYFSEKPMTQQALANRYGISGAAMSKRLKKILGKLFKFLG